MGYPRIINLPTEIHLINLDMTEAKMSTTFSVDHETFQMEALTVKATIMKTKTKVRGRKRGNFPISNMMGREGGEKRKKHTKALSRLN